MAEEKPKSNCKTSAIIAIIVIVIFFGLGFFMIWRMFGPFWPFGEENKTSPSTTTKTTTTKTTDKNLIGTWESDCLVPDSNSPWSEKHHFEFKADGTATHTRWSSDGNDCSASMTLTDTYKYTIPKAGQINLQDMEKGATIYDIYSISGNTLKFGHGFRSNLPYPAGNGESASSRIESLNDYIIYNKIK